MLYLRCNFIKLCDVILGLSEQIFVTKIQLYRQSFLLADDVLEPLVLDPLKIVKRCLAPVSRLYLKLELYNVTSKKVLSFAEA